MTGKKILLDTPTDWPALGYGGIATALAGIIRDSQPNFAIGIFGGWGSGKTTLMGAIKTALPTDGILTVDFNAWRFEREPQLLVPLLDSIRGALAERATLYERSKNGDGLDAKASAVPKLRAIAGRVGRIVRALATGLSGSAGIPGAITVKYDARAALEALDELAASSSAGQQEADAPKSLYVAAFRELQAAFEDLGGAGLNRIVVFVDDLDRCLPANALDVLESIKLFFDLPGFIFVVGLDESAIDRAIMTKLAAPPATPTGAIDGGMATATAASSAASSAHPGREYAKKIFQIPYTLPVMLPKQLDDLLKCMYAEAGITDDQLADLRTRVRPYLDVIAVQRRVNPREVKRFINSYTLQTLIRPDLVPEAILALQTLAFRPDWQAVYDAASMQPNKFGDTLEAYRAGMEVKFKEEFPELPEFSAELKSFLGSDLLIPLLDQPDLDPYLSSIESVRELSARRTPSDEASHESEQGGPE